MQQIDPTQNRVSKILKLIGLTFVLAIITAALYPKLVTVRAQAIQDQAAPSISPEAFWATGSSLPTPLIRSVGVYFPPNGKFYSVGGRTSDAAGTDVQHVLEFTGPTAPGSWVQKGVTLPDNQVNNMACGVLTVSGTSKIYCVGGSAAGTVTATARVFSYDPVADTATTLPAGDNWPGDVSGTVLPGGFAVVGNKLYIIGSFDINLAATNQIWEFDPTKGLGAKWTPKVNAPVNLIYAPTTAIDGIIFVAGASDWAGGLVIDTTHSFSFNPALNSTSAIAPIPRATGETRAVTIDGKMYVLGGGRVAPNPSSEVDVFDPVSNSWTTAQSFVTARRNFAADTNGRYIYLAGGYDNTGVVPLSSMEIYDSAPTADLGIAKVTSNLTPVAGGAAFSYTLTVTNFGPNDATDVVVTDPLPPGIFLANNNINIVPNASGFSCTTPPIGSNGTITCKAANMQFGVTETFTIVAQVSPDLAGGVRTNTATVTSGTTEPIPNAHANSSSIAQTITNNASLSIVKNGPATVCPGDTYTYQVSVSNSGSSSSVNTTVTDNLPPNTTFVSVFGSGDFAGNCIHNGGLPGAVTCVADFIRSGTGSAAADITVKLGPNASGTVTNNATLATGVGTIVGPNPASSTATVGCVTTLAIGNTTVTEGTGGTTNATFTVTMSAPSSQTVTVDYITSDVTATAPSDYTSQAGTLTFAPGVTTRNIIVPVIPDNVPEPNETFLVTLLNPINSSIATAQGTGTINDDDATGSFQFSAATSTIGEAGPTVTLTINRTGDTSGVSSVGFETSDVTALQRTDYTFNSGTVQFGPGDTSKTIKISIVDDVFVEGAETFRVNLVNPSGNFVINSPGINTVTITDNDVPGSPNPIDNTNFFVRQQYLDFLGREPDGPGLTFWTNNINSCGADLNCIAVKRIDTSASFFLSIEFQETSGNVIRTQRVAFSRLSSDPGSRVPYLTFMRDTRQVGAGVVIGQPGADALLEANKQAYAAAIVASPAFLARFPVTPGPVYVDALFASAGVAPTAAERTAAINAFGAGGTAGRIAALRSASDSASLRAAESNPSFVLAEYYGYLRRNPTDAPDFNDSGYQFWLTKLNAFSGDFRAAEMVKAFLTSFEYRGRFGTP